ncbi:MAG: hypothetical protein ACE15B_20890 [Bryobacteraceae bacterium]
MRRRWFLTVPALAACGGRDRAALPETVGGWRRVAGAQPQVPALLQRSLRRASAAEYQGAGTATVSVFELASSAAALDAVQRWRPEPDAVIFHRDNYFVRVRSSVPDRRALGAFMRALEKHFQR